MQFNLLDVRYALKFSCPHSALYSFASKRFKYKVMKNNLIICRLLLIVAIFFLRVNIVNLKKKWYTIWEVSCTWLLPGTHLSDINSTCKSYMLGFYKLTNVWKPLTAAGGFSSMNEVMGVTASISCRLTCSSGRTVSPERQRLSSASNFSTYTENAHGKKIY